MRRGGLATLVALLAALVAAVVGAAFVVFLVTLSSLRDATEAETRSKDVTAATLGLETLAVNMESGIRGYVITRRPAFLQPYRRARAEWPRASARLQRLVRGDHAQASRVRNVDARVRGYVEDYAEPVLRIADLDPETARGRDSTNEGKRRLDAIRRVFGRIVGAESARSRERAHAADATERRAEIGVAAALVLSVVLVLLFGDFVVRALARPVRRAADAATAVAHGDLDVRLPENGIGEAAALAAAFNAMTRALADQRRLLIEQNEQLQASERHKSDLISMVSHEVRTPLSSVLGFTALLLQREFPPEERRRYLEVVDAEARRLAALAEDFLDVRLLEEGRFDLRLEEVELVTLVREQVLLFFANATDHRVVVDVPPQSVVVDGDRDRLAQVIGNLLSNAIKYSPGGGEVEVGVRMRRTTARVTVADHGVGIPAEHRRRIFERFFRGSAPSAGIAGTGIGLAVAREIVEAHGGTLDFTTAEGVGSTFWIELPLSSREPDEASALDRASRREPSHTRGS